MHRVGTPPTRLGVGIGLALAMAVPLLWSLVAALLAAVDAVAWQTLTADTQTLPALGRSLWTGLASTALACAVATRIAAQLGSRPCWQSLGRWLGPLLAVPHAAFAIGVMLLIAPSGWLLRLLSPWATGLHSPPPWQTTQDPWGLGLIAVLVAKEVPFLLWVGWAQLQRADLAQRWQKEMQLAHSMGYGAHQSWRMVVWPQLWPRLVAPVAAVLAYGLTVVDVALVIGPTSPPTLAVLAWQWLQSADPAVQARGAVAGWTLAVAVVLACGLAWRLSQLPLWRERWVKGVRKPSRTPTASGLFVVLVTTYLLVVAVLLAASVVGIWPFPALMPRTMTSDAWQHVADSASTLVTTVGLGIACALAALAWSVAWLEWAPRGWDKPLRQALFIPLVLPAVLWVAGLHGMALTLGIDATMGGLWLGHTLAATPYVMLSLHGAYAGFDRRLAHTAASLGRHDASFLLRVKWPLLRAPLASAFAIGFSVSVAQYLATIYIGAGRFATVTTEAIQQASAGQRTLTAAYAVLQWLLPVVAFALAARVGRARRF